MKKNNAAKGVDDALAWLVDEAKANKLRPGEFTAESAMERLRSEGVEDTIESLRCRFKRMHQVGKLEFRKVLINGKWTNAWRNVP